MLQQTKNKAVILLSSGLDSSVNLLLARKTHDVVLALTFDYKQVAAKKEIAAAKALARSFKIPHVVVDVKWFSEFSASALNEKQEIPVETEISIDDREASLKSAARVWVPNRNGIFLNIAAGYAEGLGAQTVVPGFNKEEASTFPDNSQEFLDQLNASFKYSTDGRVKVECFTTSLDKTEIVRQGVQEGLKFENIWPCYQARAEWCGTCESCQRFARALKANGLSFSSLQAQSGQFIEGVS